MADLRSARIVIAGAVLVGCRPAAPPAPPAAQVAEEPSCIEAATNLATLFGAPNPGAHRQQCAEQRWSPAVIACAATAATAHEGSVCFAEMTLASPLCASIAALVEAGRDGEFASVRAAALPFNSTAYASTISLNGDNDCTIFSAATPAYARCEMLRTRDAGAQDLSYETTTELVNQCLIPAGWARADETTPPRWEHPGGALPAVTVETELRDGLDYFVTVHVIAP